MAAEKVDAWADVKMRYWPPLPPNAVIARPVPGRLWPIWYAHCPRCGALRGTRSWTTLGARRHARSHLAHHRGLERSWSGLMDRIDEIGDEDTPGGVW
jgi:hypothetical protein